MWRDGAVAPPRRSASYKLAGGVRAPASRTQVSARIVCSQAHAHAAPRPPPPPPPDRPAPCWFALRTHTPDTVTIDVD
ncbi:hypothetical protein JYU34_011364 [Plutella xylostella]|uniref:Uncharacterized protein n=1 Tax=Plutella xylostella TaxID=51655 RepID=A0ABQ7QGU8_PLUXY|nr:hypothetical protein JYU34_011364 [Plutella xylostella]